MERVLIDHCCECVQMMQTKQTNTWYKKVTYSGASADVPIGSIDAAGPSDGCTGWPDSRESRLRHSRQIDERERRPANGNVSARTTERGRSTVGVRSNTLGPTVGARQSVEGPGQRETEDSTRRYEDGHPPTPSFQVERSEAGTGVRKSCSEKRTFIPTVREQYPYWGIDGVFHEFEQVI